MIDRRQFMAGGAALVGARMGQVRAATDPVAGLPATFARIETQSGGRLGVALKDVATGRIVGHRENERFAMCSTFKMLLAAAILARVDAGHETLSRSIVLSSADLAGYSPVTKSRLGGDGLSVAALCEAAVTMSDNTAANALLRQIDGPPGLTRFARSIGDSVTRLDRTETTLNEARPGDPRDTTQPAAMAVTLEKLALGSALSPASRDRLAGWLKANKTGDARLRAGVPKSWVVGDKTGTNDNGTVNDIGIFWPPSRAPLILCVYLTETKASPDQCNATIAAVARAVADAYGV